MTERQSARYTAAAKPPSGDLAPRRTRSKYGYDVVGEREGPEFPNVGPGNRKIPMTMPKYNLPPYEEDEA